MANEGEVLPFFCTIGQDLKIINKSPDEAIKNLIARDDVFYNKTLFRAFLHLSKEECDAMTLQEYLDYLLMFRETMKLFHAPYQKK